MNKIVCTRHPCDKRFIIYTFVLYCIVLYCIVVVVVAAAAAVVVAAVVDDYEKNPNVYIINLLLHWCLVHTILFTWATIHSLVHKIRMHAGTM